MADPDSERLTELSNRSPLTFKRYSSPLRPRVGRHQLVIWTNETAGDVRLLFRGPGGRLHEISGSYQVDG